MSDDDLKKQVHRERNRINRLRNSDEVEDMPRTSTSGGSGSSSTPWFSVLLIGLLCLFIGRLISSKAAKIPENALLPTELAKANSVAETAKSLIISPKERVTDDQVRRMLTEMNNTPTTPRPVQPGVSGQMINVPAAETPQLVRVKGHWLKKSPENIYNVKGENIYYEDKRKKQ